jgi:hypothetical protein
LRERLRSGRVMQWSGRNDLGNRAFALPSAQGIALKAKLDEAGIHYETGPQSIPYLKRTRWALNEHRDVLRELAKR